MKDLYYKLVFVVPRESLDALHLVQTFVMSSAPAIEIAYSTTTIFVVMTSLDKGKSICIDSVVSIAPQL